MAERYTINMITPTTKNWTCKVQVVDKSRPRDNKDKTTKYQVLILQDEEENQVQVTIFSTDITHFEKEFAPFKTYLVSVAFVKEPSLGYENSLNKFIWALDKNTIVEPVEEVKPQEDPLPPPTRLALATFDTFEYQPKEFEFDVLAIVINGSPSTKTATGKRIQEFIVMDKLKKPTKLTLWENFIDHDGVKLFNQLHDYPIILARRIGKSSSRTSNRFVGLTSKFNTTIEINPPYPQAAELRTWIKTIETKLVAYKMKSTTPIGSIMLIPFDGEVIYVANIQAQPPGQVFNVEAELSLPSKDQLFSVLACSNCKQLFTRYNVRREIYFTSCHRSTHLIPRCQFEVTIKDNNDFATAIVSDEIAEKLLHLTLEEIYEICFVKVHITFFAPNNHKELVVCFASFRITPAYFGPNKWYQSHGSMMESGYRWMFILAGVVQAAIFLTVMKIFVGEIVSERFSVSRRRFDGGNYGEEMQDPKDYVKKKETLSLQNVEDQLNGKIFNIQMKRLFTKKLDATQNKQTIEHLSSGEKEYPSMANKYNPSTHKHSMEMKNCNKVVF
ncbi:hypothetical protein MTR67_003870, partial [Solanum verrucosum]